MKKIILSLFILFTVNQTYSQETGIPSWFLEEMEMEVGTWFGDNANYKSAQEPYDSYVIVWEWGVHKNTLNGKMYGIRDGKKSDVFWSLLKYWDASKKLPVAIQFGMDGTVGVGNITKINEKEAKLPQVFTAPDGSQYKTGHKIITINNSSYIGSSYSVDKQGKWTKNRSYTWVKKM